MAGVKVTDLTSTSTAAATDVFYIVDTGANQSKQIEVQNIYSGMPQFESGSFTPVISNETDILNVVVDGGLYSRVGDIVNMSFRLSFELASTTIGNFNFSLPIATAFTTRYQLMGVAKFNNSLASDNTNYVIEADNSNPTLGIVSITSSAAADTFQDCEMMVQYQIL